MKQNKWIVIVAAAAMGVAGCASLQHAHNHRATSLYQYLYSKEESHVDKPTIPTLSLPLRVGVAFVPPDSAQSSERYDLPEENKIKLMKQISAEFKAYPFVKSIDQIPTAYLTARGGFANLDQLRTIYGIDVMALISYDQVQFTDNDSTSLWYSAPFGVFYVQGEKNETKTMVDAAVYDIASRKMLFRAPGTSSVKDASTLLNQTVNLRKNTTEGYETAATNLITNLRVALNEFKDRVKTSPEEYKVVRTAGYTGVGALGAMDVLLIAVFASASLWIRREGRK